MNPKNPILKFPIHEEVLIKSELAFTGGNVFNSQAMMKILKAKGAPIEIDHRGRYYAQDDWEWRCDYDTLFKTYTFYCRKKEHDNDLLITKPWGII